MKFIKFIIVFLLFVNCKENVTPTPLKFKENALIEKTKKESDNLVIEKKNNDKNINLIPFDFDEVKDKNMISLMINEDQTKVIEKYSIDVSGICYSCEVANIMLTENNIILSNSCDASEKKYFDIINISKTNLNLEISFLQKGKEIVLLISKIEKLPVFKIKIDDRFRQVYNLKINEIYTSKKTLSKLAHNSCEGFEG